MKLSIQDEPFIDSFEHIKEYSIDESYQKSANCLVKEFTNEFCNEDGNIDWEKLVEFNFGN